LSAKQRALECLRVALADPTTDGDVVLAAVLFFVNFELIDFGKGNWETHLHGATEILSLLNPEGDGGRAGRLLRDCIVSDFVMYVSPVLNQPKHCFEADLIDSTSKPETRQTLQEK
jgi:hypothetical protein